MSKADDVRIIGSVATVSASADHNFSKEVQQSISLVEGLGVQGDAHFGATVQHRSRVKKDPAQPNLRQVHLLAAELIHELNAAGFDLRPGAIGENVLTKGIDLLRLPRGTRLHIGDSAVVEVTGLRDPCRQLNDYRPGLMEAVLEKDQRGHLIQKAGIMTVVHKSGEVRHGDEISVALPALPHQPLDRV
jgi:MOSC domain-containing protein YiiM